MMMTEDLKYLSVRIYRTDGEGNNLLEGSGTLFEDNGNYYVMTAYHCLSKKDDKVNVDENLNPSNGYLLRYNSQVGKWCAEKVELNDLSNVNIAGTPADGAVLVYNAAQAKWIPGNVQSDPYYEGTTAPTNTHIFWIDTGNGGIMKRYNGSAWVTIPSVWT